MSKLLLKLVVRVWETIFPVRKDYQLVSNASETDLLNFITPTDHLEFVSLLPFKEPLVRATVHEAKFYHNEKAWRMLGLVLHEYLKHYPTNTGIIPVPLANKRYKERGYNQVTKVVKAVNKINKKIIVNEKTLIRIVDTVPQTLLTKAERKKNVASAFDCRDKHIDTLKDKHVIVLDDVATTGSTLKAARAKLAPHEHTFTSLTCLALAH